MVNQILCCLCHATKEDESEANPQTWSSLAQQATLPWTTERIPSSLAKEGPVNFNIPTVMMTGGSPPECPNSVA